jgi:hypothetical protein
MKSRRSAYPSALRRSRGELSHERQALPCAHDPKSAAPLQAPDTFRRVVLETREDVYPCEDHMSGKYNPDEDPAVLATRAEKEARRIAHEKGVERSEWLNLWRTYERCVEIAELVWTTRLDGDTKAQQALAENMRDRIVSFGENSEDVTVEGGTKTFRCRRCGATSQFFPHHACSARDGGRSVGEIPVPLFTPRDRAQLIKEAAARLLICADRRGLGVRYPKERPDAPEETQASPEPGIEAASGAAEEAVEQETGASSTSGAPE